MEPTLTDTYLGWQRLPYTAYELRFVWRSATGREDVLERIDVEPIVIERHGILIGSGATAPSITARDASGVRFLGSARDYFATKDDAEAAAQKEMDDYRKSDCRRHAEALARLYRQLDDEGVPYHWVAGDGLELVADDSNRYSWGDVRIELKDDGTWTISGVQADDDRTLTRAKP